MDSSLHQLTQLSKAMAAQQDPESCLRHALSRLCDWLPTQSSAIYLRGNDHRFRLALATDDSFPSDIRSLSGQRFEIGTAKSAVGFLAISETKLTATQQKIVRKFARALHITTSNFALMHELRAIRQGQVILREEERRKLRRNLHNGIGPTLAGLNLYVRSAEDHVRDKPSDASEKLVQIRQIISTVIIDIRRVIYNLRPPALDEFGLLGAIRAQAEVFQAGTLNISLDLPDKVPLLSAATEVAVYRIIQEALSNIVRHSEATQCSVVLSFKADHCFIQVTDNGIGNANTIRSGVGIASMRELAAELDGKCDIVSLPTGGIRVSATLPLNHTSA